MPQPLVYGAPGAIYDAGLIYDKPIDAVESSGGSIFPAQPSRPAVTLRFYDAQGILQAIISSNSGYNLLKSARWDETEQGCGRLDLELFAHPPGLTISHNQRVDVHLWNQSTPYWSGTIDYVPGSSSTSHILKFRGMGYVAKLSTRFIEYQRWTTEKVQFIVDSLARDLEATTGIVYNGSKISYQEDSIYEPQELRFIRAPLDKILEQLTALAAAGWVYGVDSTREFFFRPIDTTITSDYCFIVGPHLPEWEPSEDSSRIANRIFVKHGKINEDSASNYYRTNFLELSIEDPDSQEAYGIRDKTVSAPSVYATVDAYRLGGVELERSKDPETRVTVPGIKFTGTRIQAGRYARILSSGQTFELKIERVTYQVDARGFEYRLQFGERPDDLEKWAADLERTRVKEELERQISQNQFALI